MLYILLSADIAITLVLCYLVYAKGFPVRPRHMDENEEG